MTLCPHPASSTHGSEPAIRLRDAEDIKACSRWSSEEATPPVIQPHTPRDAEGIKACSRWSSEERATPPDIDMAPMHPGGRASNRRSPTTSKCVKGIARGWLAHPPGCGHVGSVNRRCRSCLAQPPATSFYPFGIWASSTPIFSDTPTLISGHRGRTLAA